MLTSFFGWIDHITSGNQIVAGAITLVLTGSVSYVCRSFPKQMALWVWKQCTTRIIMTNNNGTHEFYRFLRRISESANTTGTRTLSVDFVWSSLYSRQVPLFSVGLGGHFVWLKNRLIYVSRQRLDMDGGELIREQITITKLGRDHGWFREIMADFDPYIDKDVTERVPLFSVDSDMPSCWRFHSYLHKISLDELAIDAGLIRNLRDQISFFVQNEDFYRAAGIAHKLVVVMHGEPGTGKTSIIRALASEFKLNLASVNVMDLNDG